MLTWVLWTEVGFRQSSMDAVGPWWRNAGGMLAREWCEDVWTGMMLDVI